MGRFRPPPRLAIVGSDIHCERTDRPRESEGFWAMIDAMNEKLERLRTDNDLELAAVAADGMLVAADGTEDVDAEGICATAADGYLVMTALGIELSRGEQRMLTIEYSGGTVVVCPLEHGAVLVMLTGSNPNLGRLRLAARRFQSQYGDSAAQAA